MISFLLFLVKSSTERFLESSSDHKNFSYSEDGEIDLNGLNSFKFSFEEPNSALFIYNGNNFITSIYRDDQLVEKKDTEFSYIFLKNTNEFVLVEKKEKATSNKIMYTAIKNFGSDANYLFTVKSLNEFSMFSKKNNENGNYSFTKGKNRIAFISPYFHDFKITVKCESFKKANILFTNKLNQEEIINLKVVKSVSFTESKSFIFEYETGPELSDEANFVYKTKYSEIPDQKIFWYNTNMSDLTTNFYMQISDDSLSEIPDSGIICVFEGNIPYQEKCKNYPTIKTKLAKKLIPTYLSTKSKDLTLHILGTENVNFEALEMDGANLNIKGHKKEAKVTMRVSKINQINVDSIHFVPIDSVSNKKFFSIGIHSSYFEAETLTAENIDIDYKSLSTFNKLTCDTLKISGKHKNLGKEITLDVKDLLEIENHNQITYSNLVTKFDIFSLISQPRIKNDAKKFSLKIKTSLTKPFYFDIAAETIDIAGAIDDKVRVNIRSDTELNTEGYPVFTMSDNLAIKMLCYMTLKVNWESFKKCREVKLDFAGFDYVDVNDAAVYISGTNGGASIPATIKKIILVHTVKDSYMEIRKGASLTNVPSELTVLIDDGTETLLTDWGKYEGRNKLNLVAIGADFRIKCTETSIPECISFLQEDGKPVDADAVIIKEREPVKQRDYSIKMAFMLIIPVFVAFAIVFIVFFTPCGNFIGLTTYGIFGKEVTDYKEYTDQDAGIVF